MPQSTASRPTIAPAPVTVAPVTRPRSWLRRIIGGGQIVETCPSWCTSSHANHGLGMLTDLVHSGPGVATDVEVFDQWSGALPVTAAMPLLAARIQVDPYSDDPRRSTPHVSLEPWPDEVMEALTPGELAAVIAQVRAHCDRLEQMHAELVEALAEHPGTPASA